MIGSCSAATPRGSASNRWGKTARGRRVIVPWHQRRPIVEGSALESNRVDIGVFVHNGEYYSPPAFLTYLFLDHEARTYDPSGRLLEIGYGQGGPDLQVPDWVKLLALLRADEASPGGRFLKKILPAEQAKILLRVGDEYKEKSAALDSARKAAAEASKQKRPEAEIKPLREAENKARKAVEDLLANKREGLPASPKETVLGAIRTQLARATFCEDGPDLAPKADLRKRFITLGLLKDVPGGAIVPPAALQPGQARSRRAYLVREGALGAIQRRTAEAADAAGRAVLRVPCQLRQPADLARRELARRLSLRSQGRMHRLDPL